MRSIYSTNPNVWISADGRKIPIPEMEDTHLMNTIGMLHRKAKKLIYDRAWDDFNSKKINFSEFTRQISDEAFNWMDAQVCIPSLIAEADKRGLDWKSYVNNSPKKSNTVPPIFMVRGPWTPPTNDSNRLNRMGSDGGESYTNIRFNTFNNLGNSAMNRNSYIVSGGEVINLPPGGGRP